MKSMLEFVDEEGSAYFSSRCEMKARKVDPQGPGNDRESANVGTQLLPPASHILELVHQHLL